MPRPRFDWEAFWLSYGIGTGLVGAGGLLYWATSTAPARAATSRSLTAAQQVARALPQQAQSKIAIALSVAFVLFGVLLLGLGLKTTVEWYLTAAAEPARAPKPRRSRQRKQSRKEGPAE